MLYPIVKHRGSEIAHRLCKGIITVALQGQENNMEAARSTQPHKSKIKTLLGNPFLVMRSRCRLVIYLLVFEFFSSYQCKREQAISCGR